MRESIALTAVLLALLANGTRVEGQGDGSPRMQTTASTTVNHVRSNETLFANFVWDLSTAVQLGLQVDYRKTNYTQFLPNAFLDSDVVIVASRFLWKF